MKIGILGSGDVAKALAKGFTKHGHKVMLGTREPSKLDEWQKTAKDVLVASFKDAAIYGELVVVATLGAGTENAITLAEINNFDGKIVIDTTNPLDFSKGTPPVMTMGATDSLGEMVQLLLPKAHVVKCFNTVGNVHMVDPEFPEKPDMFICGNDEASKKAVTNILYDFGWGVVDIGDIKASRYLEPMSMVWISYGFKTNTWNHAFKLLRK